MLYAVFASLVVVGFLTNLNGFLRGSKTQAVDAILSVAFVGLLIAAFALGGWFVGVCTLVGTFVTAAITRPFAAATAVRLFGVGQNTEPRHHSGLPPSPIQRISATLGGPVNLSDISQTMAGAASKKQALDELFAYCESQESTVEIIKELGLNRSALDNLYHRLIIFGCGQWVCGHWVAASAFAFPHTLKYLATASADTFQMACYHVIVHFERGAPLTNDEDFYAEGGPP